MNSNDVLFSLLVIVVLVWIDTRIVVASLSSHVGGNGGVIMMNNKKCIDHERHALLDFKANIFHDPEGFLSSWGVKEEEDCCKWSGVTCNNQTGHVTGLNLLGGRLEGEISPSLLNLTYLSSLHLSHNSLYGTIPMSIGSLNELTSLDLSYNSLNGIIPLSIGSLARLRELYLSFNSLNGTIPMSIGSLTELRFLYLSSNSLTGTIPSEFGNLINLENLSLGGKFGSLAIKNQDWLRHMTQLHILSINGISLANLDNWVNVILSLDKLSYLRLSNCDLSQVIRPYSSSINFSSLSNNIVYLDLSNNSLNYSSMYNWLFPLTTNNLDELDISGNKLDGIPKYIGNLASLRTLHLYNNSVVVSFSDFLYNLSSCTLQYLYASHSQFTGSLSDDIQSFSSLVTLDLSDNQLNGSISEKLWDLPNLQNLYLSSNSLKGPSKANMSNPPLSIIDLSSNNLYGLISNVPSNLYILNLSKNKFYGEISFLCKIFDGVLRYLDLSHNTFSGQLPDCLWNFKDLIVLNLGNNKLFGRIPTSLESLIRLEVLNLYNNIFSGELPLSLKNCTELNILDLGGNNFSSNFPVWIGENLSKLYYLSLKSNNFFGHIPLELCQLVYLQILDLSLNNLYGTIPSCLNNLTFMVQKGFLSTQNLYNYRFWRGGYENLDNEYVDHSMIQWQGNIQEFSTNLRLLKSIDISSNNLTGNFPYELTDLLGLVALNLSKNSLIGEIPQSVGQMKELLTLDLSRNDFSGKIPSSISQMTSLSYLDVSYNNLSGRVPTGSQLQTFEPQWFTGNVGLCGLPATKHCPGDKDLHVQPAIGENEDGGDIKDDLEKWFYIGGASGFASGFWIVCSALLLNIRGRRAFFNFLDNLKDWVYVKVMVLIAKSGAGA